MGKRNTHRENLQNEPDKAPVPTGTEDNLSSEVTPAPNKQILSHVELSVRYSTDLVLAIVLFMGFFYCSKFLRYIPTVMDAPTWLVNISGIASLVLISFTSLWLVTFVANETASFVVDLSRTAGKCNQ